MEQYVFYFWLMVMSFIAIFVGLVDPKWVFNKTRRQVLATYLLATVGSAMLFAVNLHTF
jgi:Ni/Fe-hydrogenase subunit HybB-like protein